MRLLWNGVCGWLGIESVTVSHTEKIVSLVGGFAGILGIMFVSGYTLGAQGGVLVIASMGASAVLLFAVPHGPLSQPWPLVGGHLVSAMVGVSCAKLVPIDMVAAPLPGRGRGDRRYVLPALHSSPRRRHRIGRCYRRP